MMKKLNPVIHTAVIYERVDRSEERRPYDCRIIYLISGELTVTVQGEKPQRMAPGALIFIPAGTVYKLKSKYMRAAVLTFDLYPGMGDDEVPCPAAPAEFKEALCRCGENTSPFDKVMYLSDMEAERDEFIKLTELFTSAQGEYLASGSARLKLILIKLAETLDKNALPPFMVESLDSYIRENCADEISGTEIGAVFGYHPYYISSMLKERKGLTVKQYVTDYRLKLAKRMLAYGSGSIADIADACGFTDASYFAKIFRSATGMSPKDYRNKFKDKFI